MWRTGSWREPSGATLPMWCSTVDLAWSPDSSQIVSCGLDCSVRVWHAATGVQIASLEGHQSLVKGVAWDPIGSFIASQSDDKTVRVWQTRDWSLVTTLEGHFGKTVGATFFRRLGWSPCGSFLTTTHAFADPQHTAAVIDRTDWSKDFDFVGHGAPVVAVRYNSSLFRMPPSDPREDGKGEEAVAGADTITVNTREGNEAVKKGDQNAGGGKDETLRASSKKREGPQDSPYHCLAIGSQDCQLTVWASNRSKPVMIGKHFFQQPVVDLAWSPDGYTLLACSTDGSLSAFIFSPQEIGVPLSLQEMDAIKLERYGKVRGGQAPIAESADLISLRKHTLASPSIGNSQKTGRMTDWTIPVSTNSANIQTPIQTRVSKPEYQPMQKPMQKLDSTVGTPPRQVETRRADGRRRIVPQAVVGPTSRTASEPPEVLQLVVPARAPEPTGEALVPSELSGGSKRVFESQSQGQERNGEAALEGERGTRSEIAKRPRTSGEGLRSPPPCRIESVRGKNTVFVCGPEDFQDRDIIASLPSGPKISVTVTEEGQAYPFMLEARTEDLGASLFCTQKGSLIWKDTIASLPVALAGSPFFWAVGSKDGNLQVYTRGGRRALPLICLGSPAALMVTDNSWRLLVVTLRGNIQLWDLQSSRCLLRETAAPLLSTSGTTVPLAISSARITDTGSVLLCLESGHSFLFQPAMQSWLCVAQDSFPLSQFASSWPPSSSGTLAAAQAGLRQRRGDGSLFASTVSSLVGRGREEEKEQTRGHLEDQVANSAALRSEVEYRQWLLAYVRHLTREGDEVRLREVCQELLGPPINDPSQLASIGWQPVKLGLVRRQFLRAEVLPAMASNFTIQRLAQEFLELLKEIEDS